MPQAKSDVHLTPDRVWEIIQDTWNYTKSQMFDPCPVNPNFDGLKVEWNGLNYVNPPYTLLADFVDKAILEAVRGNRTIMLLPAKTDQAWFHKLLENKYEIIWIRKRLKFKNNKHHATQPHFLVCID
jgi:hypothetical protein